MQAQPIPSYKMTYNMKQQGTFFCFQDAFLAMKFLIEKELKEKGCLSVMMLETCCWIQHGDRMPLMFNDARDQAVRLGII